MEYEVTIGIPVYNVGRHIRLTMDSALAQTFPSIEFLILDDCGTDDSMDIVRSYQQNHPRGKNIRIVRQPQNMGLGAGRNRLIDEARGRYFYFLDADDEIVPQTIALLYENAQRYQAEIVYGSRVNIIETDGSQAVVPYVYPSMQFLEADQFATYVYGQYDRLQAQIWNFLIEVDVYRRNHIRYKPVNFWEDFTTTMDLPTYITRAVLLPDITYHYYLRNGSLSNFQSRKEIKKEEILATKNAIEQIKDGSERLYGKAYFPQRMWKVMITCFYVVSMVMRSEKIITPPFANRELRDFMRYPIPLSMVLRFRQWRMRHVLLFSLGVLPPSVAVRLMRMVAKYKKLL